jgi:hypothetical protein
MSLRRLQDTQAGSNQQSVVQLNFELIEYDLYTPTAPTKQAGVATTIIGPPTSGTWVLRDRWVDTNGSEWSCVTAGTPGSWVQLRPALMSADPGAGSYSTGYLIMRTDARNILRYYDGTTWQDVLGARNVTMQDGVNIATGTATGTKIGTGSTQKLGFYGASPVARPAGVADATGGATIDTQARVAINAVITALETLGLLTTV